MRIEEALGRFVIQLEADGRSVHTRRQYKRHIRLLAHWARDVGRCGERIESLSHEHVAAFLASGEVTTRPDGEVKKATAMNCLRSSIRGFFSYCHQAGYIPQNSARLVRRAVCSPPPPKALSEDEQGRLLEALSKTQGQEAERDYALFCFMLGTGVRLGSALALDIEDVDLARGEVSLRHTKGNRAECVFLSDEIREHLRSYLGDRDTGPVFLARGVRVSNHHVQRRFSQALRAAGITRRLGCHSLRHSFAMRVYGKTEDILLVKEALGHRSIASTLIYAHADRTRLREVV